MQDAGRVCSPQCLSWKSQGFERRCFLSLDGNTTCVSAAAGVEMALSMGQGWRCVYWAVGLQLAGPDCKYS